MDKQFIIEKLSTIKPKLQAQYGVTELALFGSYSRNEQHKDSDIDIMINFEKKLGYEYLDLVYELESLFSIAVQVVSKKGIKERYFNAIKNDLIYA